jgi:hypothetical protein
VQIGDVNHDGRADACGRKSDGIYCTINTGTGSTVAFANAPTRWVNAFVDGNLFSPGWESSESRYGSIRLVDVNNDTWLDVCGRGPNGIECALNKKVASGAGVGFNAPTSWAAPTAPEFVDTPFIGWQTDGYGSTIRFADIDGDGKVDVCGRGAEGMICAINDGLTPGHFVQPHLWTSDFSDYESWDDNEWRYGTIRLGDINGDGRADVCGRGASGLKCGLSLGSSFAPALDMITSGDYDDASGWNADRYSAFGLMRLNAADTHLDVCARGPVGGGSIGLRCGFSP